MINEEGVDLLEISGGAYEQPQLFGYQGDAQSAKADTANDSTASESTKAREAYFLDYARQVKALAKMPVMVTGGFRSREVMQHAIESGDADVIGLGRPMCGDPEIAGKLLRSEVDETPRFEQSLKVMSGNQASPLKKLWPIQVFGQQAWYYMQIFRLGKGKNPKLSLKPMMCFLRFQNDEFLSALHLKRRKPPLQLERPKYVRNS